jgi:translocation and assembly module TamB
VDAKFDRSGTDTKVPVRSRKRRGLLIGFLVLVLLGVGGFVLARRVLASQYVADQVAERLSAVYGGSLEVGQADIGLQGSALRGLKLYEADREPSQAPWIAVEDVRADVSLWDLLGGKTEPHELTLSGADIILRFDAAGHMLTRFPKPTGKAVTLPDIQVAQGKLTLHQEGRPDLVLGTIEATLHTEGDKLVLTGTVTDSYWGHWTVHGSVDRATDQTSLTLRNDGLHVTQDMLERLPFVPANVWQQVQQIEGDTPVDLTLQYDASQKKIHYRVVIQPERVKIYVSSIDLYATEAAGKVIIEDKQVQLEDVQGRSADGTIKTDANLDFRQKPSVFQFKVAVNHVELRKLPQKWKIPRQLNGRLTGEAELEVKVIGGKTMTRGEGQGQITEARLGGLPVRKPILLNLHAEAGRFHFTHQPPTPAPQSDLRKAALLTVALQPAGSSPGRSLLDPGQAINWLGQGIQQAVDTIAHTGHQLLGRLPRAAATPAAPQAQPNYLDVNLSLDDVELNQLVRGLGYKLPFPVAGRVSFQVQVGVPLDTAGDLAAYRFKGTATSRALGLAGLRLEDVRARVTFAGGILQLEELRADIPTATPKDLPPPAPGRLDGTARYQVIPQGDLTAQLKLEHIPLAQILAFVPGGARGTQGVFSGTVRARAPATGLRNLDAWDVSGTIQTERAEAYGWALTAAQARLGLALGVLTLSDLHGQLEGMPVQGSAEVRLASPYRYQGQATVRKGDLAASRRLASQLRPPVALTGHFEADTRFEGTLRPLTLNTSGTGTARDLEVERVKAGSLTFGWKNDPDRLRLTDLRAELYDGKVTGSAVLPLKPTVAGNVEIQLKDVDVAALGKAVPAVPVRLEGRASGSLDATLAAAVPGKERTITAKVELEAPRLRIQGIPAEKLHGTVDYRNKTVDYRVEGETLGGTFHLNGQIPPAETKPPATAPEGRLQIRGARLSRLWQGRNADTPLQALHGVLDLDLRFRHEGPNRAPLGTGVFSLRRLNWNRIELTDTAIRGDLVLSEQEVRLLNLTGMLGRGVLRGQAVFPLRQLGRSSLNVALDQAEASLLLAPWPVLAARIQGIVDVRLHGRLGPEWHGSGEVALVRGRILGAEIADWRVPLNWAFGIETGRGQIEMRESTAQLAGGRVTARATLGWGWGSRVEGQVRFANLDLRTLLRQSADLTQVASGQVTGRFDFSGTDVHSVNDLTGTVEAKLQQTQALQLPILQQLTPFLMAGQSSAYFQSGDLRARLGGGILRIQRLSFSGTLLQLLVEGTITLQGGRLGLDVTAQTGQYGANPRLLRLLGLRLPAVGPIPLSLVLEVTDYLSNRLVHLRVTGTWRSPVITVEPISLLTDEAVLFFLNRSSLPIP